MKISTQLLLSLLLVCVCGLPASAGELLLSFSGKSSYQLVVPDTYSDKVIERTVKQAAGLLVQAFVAQGVTLAVIKEADAAKDIPTIYLGNTNYAADNGVTFKPDSGWTYTWKVVGKNLIIAGNDQPDPIPLAKRRPREAKGGGIQIIGTLKGTCEFIYNYMGARFLIPGADGLVFEPTPIVYVPDDLNTTRRPYAQDMEISRSNDLFRIANGQEVNPQVLSNYGHYHKSAIPTEEYGKTHPEYFVWSAGRRHPEKDHYCFSNPEVRELIYKKVLEDSDTGYKIIEMGHDDAFNPCQCDKCYDLYGIHPTRTSDQGYAYQNDPAWGEKIWIMHRDMAQRLLKDRPGHILMITAYSVTRNPPTSFSSFPPNVMIELMGPDADTFAAWHKLDVPGGFSSYLYTWGTYTPMRSQVYMKDLVSALVDNKVQLIQTNGKPVVYGIEGINIYAFGRMMNDPYTKPIEEYYKEYTRAAYQEAAGPMDIFYRKLHQRLLFRTDAIQYASKLNRNPLLLYSTLYTPDLMTELEINLTRADKLAKDQGVKNRLAAARIEFTYLKHIADTITFYYAYQTDPTSATFNRVLDMLDTRSQWIESLAGEGAAKTKVSNAVPTFRYRGIQSLKDNEGSLNLAPFNWDVKTLRETQSFGEKLQEKELTVTRASEPVTINSAAWKNVTTHTLLSSSRNKSPLQEQTTFKVLYDDKNLYVRVEGGFQPEDMHFDTRGRDAEMWLQECVNLQISSTSDKSRYYYLNYEPVADSFTDSQHGFITDPLHPSFGWNDNTWNGDWSYVNDLDKTKKLWVSMVTIPYKTIDATPPAKGTSWMFNLARVHYMNDKKNREVSAWAYEPNVSRTPGDGNFGQITFD